MTNKFKLIEYYLLQNRKSVSFWKKIKSLVYMLFLVDYKIEAHIRDENPNIAFFCTKNREDYWRLFEGIYSTCVDKKSVYKISVKKRFNTKNLSLLIKNTEIYKSLQTVSIPSYTNGKICYTEKKLSCYERLHIYLKYLNCRCLTYMLEDMMFYSARKIVALSDAWEEENVVLEFAQKKQIYTISCQHALFSDNEQFNVDSINYIENKVDQYLLWGVPTAELMKKYNDRINYEICGNPLFNEPLKSEFAQRNVNLWTLFLDQAKYHDFNQKMISISEVVAQRSDAVIQIKIHPNEKGREESYSINKAICSFQMISDNYGISIGHGSTMLYTQLLAGYPVFKLNSEIKIPFNSKLCFSNDEELERLICNVMEFNYIEEGKKYISCIGFESKSKYTQVFAKQ